MRLCLILCYDDYDYDDDLRCELYVRSSMVERSVRSACDRGS
jgi:hypothetical protein